MTLSRVLPGDPIDWRARDWNDLQRVENDSRHSRIPRQQLGEVGSDRGVVKVRNDTGAARSRFEIVGIGGLIVSPSTALLSFQSQVSIQAESPTFASYFGKFAILIDPIPSAGYGRALVQGVIQVKVDVQAAAHEYADVDGGVTANLRSYTGGGARILAKEGGTGVKWAYVALGYPTLSLWRFTLNADFSGSPPTAAADLLNLDGTDTTEDVTIHDKLSAFSTDLSNGDAGWCVYQGLEFHATQAPCP